MPLGFARQEAEKGKGEGQARWCHLIGPGPRSGCVLSVVCVPLHQAQLAQEMGILAMLLQGSIDLHPLLSEPAVGSLGH